MNLGPVLGVWLACLSLSTSQSLEVADEDTAFLDGPGNSTGLALSTEEPFANSTFSDAGEWTAENTTLVDDSVVTSAEAEQTSTKSTSNETQVTEETISTSVTTKRPCDILCQNGGSCESTAEGDYACHCPEPFVGQHCQLQDFCVEDEAGILCGNGACAYSEDLSTRLCKCFSGTHWDLQKRVCREAEPPCFPNPCRNGGTCRAAEFGSATTFRCTCVEGFTGSNCEIRSRCGRDRESGELCGVGKCVPAASGTERECACPEGFYLHEEALVCRAFVPPCEPNPCNGHQCEVQPDGSYNCSCDAELFGLNCAITNRCSGEDEAMTCLNGLCELSADRTAWRCRCYEGFALDELTGTCTEVAEPCFPNPCANGGQCTALSAKDYNCSCVEGFSGEECTVRDRCILDGGSVFCGDAACFTDSTRNTIFCLCDEGQYFDYGSRRCLPLDFCPLMTCKRYETCVNNSCRCLEGFKRDSNTSKCIADFCSVKGCQHESMACEEDENDPESFRCFCREGESFDGGKCTASACSFPSTNNCEQLCEQNDDGYTCLCHPNFKLKADNRSCEYVGESPCSNKTCGVGVCLYENGLEICACPPGYVEVDDTCVDACSAGQLPSGLCPGDACESHERMGFRCKCEGSYRLASDGVTCEERRLCSVGESGWSDCAQKRATCVQNEDGYACSCDPGYQEHQGLCTELCSLDENRERCFQLGADCGLDENYQLHCKCPPGFSKDENGVCNAFAPLSFLVTLPINMELPETQDSTRHRKSRRVEGGETSYTSLYADIQKSMKHFFGGLLYVNVLNCKKKVDYALCKIELQLSYLSEEENFNRLLMTSSCAYNESLSDRLCLLPPFLILRRDRIPFDVSFKKNDACDEDVKKELCYPDTTCESFEDGFTCKCKPGYRAHRKAFPVKGDARTLIESCTDVDECAENQPCHPPLTCSNTIGSYRCSCQPGYRESNQSAAGCVELCDPNPCLHGECRTSHGVFECSCKPGYSGALCNYEDKNYKGAVVNTIIVGVVLGGILLLTIILFIASVSRLRKRKFSDEPSQVLYSTEMLERRPVRLSAANPAFERD